MKSIEEKAMRMVLDGRVSVVWQSAEGEAAQGFVDGDTSTYRVSFSPEGRICTCPAGANHRNCSHGIALELAALQERNTIGAVSSSD